MWGMEPKANAWNLQVVRITPKLLHYHICYMKHTLTVERINHRWKVNFSFNRPSGSQRKQLYGLTPPPIPPADPPPIPYPRTPLHAERWGAPSPPGPRHQV